MPKKAALYIRVSTVHQIDKDSLPMQRKDLISYAHFVLGIDDYEIFEDAGYSGKNIERPAYQDMMRRCRDGEFSHILVWKIDRISRNLVDFASMYEELKKLNVSLISKNEQFDTSSAMGEASLKILLVFAELERKMASERVSATMITRAKEGKWNGANIPYGYKWDEENKYPALDETEATIVKQIFEKYANLHSLRKVVNWLSTQNVPTKRGGAWQTRTVLQMLKNPFYIGTLRYNYKSAGRGKTKPQEEWILKENNHPALIEKDLFDECQKILTRNINFTDKERTIKHVFHVNIFAGLMRCGYCGKTLKAQIQKPRNSGIQFASYYCLARYEYNTTCTNQFMYHDELVGNFIFNYISNLINAKKVVGSMRSPKELQHYLLNGKCFADVIGIAEIDSLYASLKSNVASSFSKKNSVPIDVSSADKIQQELSKKERALERLNHLFLYDDEAMPEAQYIVTKNKLRKEIVELNEKLAELSAPANNITDDSFIANASTLLLLKIFQSENYIDFVELVSIIDKPALREFVLSIVSKITTDKKRILSIEFANGSIHHFAYK